MGACRHRRGKQGRKLKQALRILASVAVALALLPIEAWADACPAGGDHDYTAALVQQATDDADGLRLFTCTKCGDQFYQVIPATGHEWGPWVVDVQPTCESEGHEYRQCVRHPGELHVEERLIARLSPTGEHTWVETSRSEPTCETAGTAHFTCSVCGATYDRELPALGHEWGPWQQVVAATDEREGLERRVCVHDASHVEERAIPALPPAASAASGIALGGGGQASAAASPWGAGLRSTADGQSASQPDPWAPNELDAALLAFDACALAAFALLAGPLLYAVRWAAARRRQAQDGPPVPARLRGDAGGRVL